ncbi:hypothetical protein [Hydrogenimonas cancrithermarum]|uniref:Methyl-accepting chemotaxis protein n=1 Tax=Hydrogenimonas cancrithermarum TaxID=2993563 RepID=A0ABN6WVJ3_9BACT|nr:hypothetical protein [Hydrogenimonas cancrithermarum]BDY13120.1 hypothetical protein HCR_14320 [Hydrogenimonas cancrithermarum]
MKKEDAVKHIEAAITAHERQLKTSRFMAYGMKVDEKDAALHEKVCSFGAWLYENIEWLKRFFGASTIEEIEKLHSLWHNENRKIYDLYLKKNTKGLLGKLFGPSGIEKGDIDRAKAYYADLKSVSDALLKRMKVLLVRAKSRPESDYEKIEEK